MTRSLQGFPEELLGRSCISLSGKPKVDSWRRWNQRHDTGTATAHPGRCTFRRPSRNHWLVSVPAGISCSVRARSAAPSAKEAVKKLVSGHWLDGIGQVVREGLGRTE